MLGFEPDFDPFQVLCVLGEGEESKWRTSTQEMEGEERSKQKTHGRIMGEKIILFQLEKIGGFFTLNPRTLNQSHNL